MLAWKRTQHDDDDDVNSNFVLLFYFILAIFIHSFVYSFHHSY